MSPQRSAAASGSTVSLTSPTSPREGDKLTFHWTTDAPHAKNWIGIYDGDRQPGVGSSLLWEYVTTESGDLALGGLPEGVYTAYLLAKDAYGILARTTPFTVTARPVIARPHAAIDSFTTAAHAPGAAVSVPLAPLWIRPQGNPSGTPAFRRITGDSWLTLRQDGTVTGTAPARAAHPGRIEVGVKDSAGGSDTVTVQVPVRTAGSRPRLTVASLNLWDAGSHIDDAHEKHLRLILGQGLDVLAVQESGGASAGALADALGWHAYESPAGVGLISRFPLTDASAPVRDVPAVAATVRMPDGRTVRLWAAQLDEAAYGPHALRDGRTAAQVEAAELKTVRYRQATALLAAMRADIASRGPVILAGGLASPSHLDDKGKKAVHWPVGVALDKAGLTDAYREAHPNATKDPGVTWSPVRPEEPRDRIDQLHFAGRLRVESAYTLCTGWPRPVPGTAGNGWPSDHAAPVVTFSLPASHA
ncbi:endonuclease/exonuclease/phosphatase family protein [Streptomyces sp. NPDC051569]|uniref:endonuclease/exonuclease/phosphatase family protein n=1 Tax=Streptomyces sp. NPDC051569 TaxID=3365661 RepID=UPI0037A147C3